jgi:hypothetical protein
VTTLLIRGGDPPGPREPAPSGHGGPPRPQVPLWLSPRVLSLAASIAWRHAAADPVRALLLAWRVLPAPPRGWLRFAGPYGRATVLWGAGERDAALAALAASPPRQAAFSLAADQPAKAAAALNRLDEDDPARPVLTARLAWREGRLTDALRALDQAPGGPPPPPPPPARPADERGGTLRYSFGHGDLVVMGGSCQRTWEHAVPKSARTAPAGPRISVQFRPRGVR